MPTIRLTDAEVAALVAAGAVLGPPVRVPAAPRGGPLAGAAELAAVARDHPFRPPPAGRKGRHPLVEPGYEWPLTFTVPVYTASGDNARGVAAGRAGAQRRAVARVIGRHVHALAPTGLAVHERGAGLVVGLTRLGGRGLDPHDGLPSAMKYVADTVCLFFGLDDKGGGPVRFVYGQEPGGRYGVRIDLSTEGGVT